MVLTFVDSRVPAGYLAQCLVGHMQTERSYSLGTAGKESRRSIVKLFEHDYTTNFSRDIL